MYSSVMMGNQGSPNPSFFYYGDVTPFVAMMGNQGSPYPSFFYFGDFTPFVAMACCAAPSSGA